MPGVMIRDTLASDGAAKRETFPNVEHWQHQRLNNGAETAHHPMRQRACTLRRCRSPGHGQRVLAAVGPIRAHVAYDGIG